MSISGRPLCRNRRDGGLGGANFEFLQSTSIIPPAAGQFLFAMPAIGDHRTDRAQRHWPFLHFAEQRHPDRARAALSATTVRGIGVGAGIVKIVVQDQLVVQAQIIPGAIPGAFRIFFEKHPIPGLGGI